jgi:hypothetical protein
MSLLVNQFIGDGETGKKGAGFPVKKGETFRSSK